MKWRVGRKEKAQKGSGGKVKMHRKEDEGRQKGAERKWREGEEAQKGKRRKVKRHRKEDEGR